jgi:uncharacterized protein (UPF0335 family)
LADNTGRQHRPTTPADNTEAAGDALHGRKPAAIVAAAAGGAASWGKRGTMPDVGGIAGERLKSLIERIERLEEEKRALAEDIKEVYAEAKGTGFDTKIMRQLIRIRKRDQDELDEEETLLDVYKRALGMLPGPAPQAQAAE